jgi:hypothetical protein
MAPLLHPARAASAVVRRATAPIRLDRNYRPVAPILMSAFGAIELFRIADNSPPVLLAT